MPVLSLRQQSNNVNSKQDTVMTFKIKSSHIVAALITVGISAWMINGELNIGGQSGLASETPTIADRQEETGEKPFRVSYIELRSEVRAETVPVRGRTQANAIIPIKAEISGILNERHVQKGDIVKEGDLVCTIDTGAREANLASAQAQYTQAEGDYSSNKKLADKGYTSETRMRQMKFAMDSAKAQVKQAELELKRTKITANASGIVQDPIAETGNVLNVGDTCVTLVNVDPMLFVGQVSERSVNNLKIGMNASVELITGQKTSGRIKYIAPSADAQTRTFLVEIELENQDKSIRDGLTASANIELPSKPSFRVSPSWLTLADNGEIGVKTIESDNKVGFLPVTILAQTNQGFWISGPAENQRIITFGQEYVIAGEVIEPVPDERLAWKDDQ